MVLLAQVVMAVVWVGLAGYGIWCLVDVDHFHQPNELTSQSSQLICQAQWILL